MITAALAALATSKVDARIHGNRSLKVTKVTKASTDIRNDATPVEGDLAFSAFGGVGSTLQCGNVLNDTLLDCGGAENPCPLAWQEVPFKDATSENCNATFFIEYHRDATQDDACAGGECPVYDASFYGIVGDHSPGNTFEAQHQGYTLLCPWVCIDNKDICVAQEADCNNRGAQGGGSGNGPDLNILYTSVHLDGSGDGNSAMGRAVRPIFYLLAAATAVGGLGA